jgi:hypothetical protein
VSEKGFKLKNYLVAQKCLIVCVICEPQRKIQMDNHQSEGIFLIFGTNCDSSDVFFIVTRKEKSLLSNSLFRLHKILLLSTLTGILWPKRQVEKVKRSDDPSHAYD